MGLFSGIGSALSSISAKPKDWEETQEYLDNLEQEVSKDKLKDSISAEKFKASKQESQNK